MKTKLFITLLLFTFINEVNAQTITGKLLGRKGEAAPFVNIGLEDTLNLTIIAATSSDNDGFYKISPVKSGYYFIITTYFAYPPTKSLVMINGDTTININMAVLCEYDKSINDKTCPVCHKTDMVIPIEYGLIVNFNGMDTTYYAGGCIIPKCPPNWYCKRDKLKF